LNDYNVLRYDTDQVHQHRPKRPGRGRRAPIDALGEQAHGLETQQTSELKAQPGPKCWALGLPLYITEYDVDQADDAPAAKQSSAAQFPDLLAGAEDQGPSRCGATSTAKPGSRARVS